MSDIKVLALDLDGTLTNDQKLVTPRTRAALDAAIEKGVTIVLASGRPTAGIQPLAEELGLDKKGGCILSYNGGKIVDCRTGETLVEKTLDPALVPELCAFAAAQDIAILTYNREGIVCERDKDEWANKECFTTKLPMIHVDDLASYVNYPVCKMLITLDPARRDAVCAAGQQQFAGRADLYPSSPFFIEAVPLGVAKDGSLAELLRRMGLTRENLMACGDGLNDRSMIAYAGVGVAMQNAEQPVKDCADYVTTADNNHDGVAEAVGAADPAGRDRGDRRRKDRRGCQCAGHLFHPSASPHLPQIAAPYRQGDRPDAGRSGQGRAHRAGTAPLYAVVRPGCRVCRVGSG